MTNKNFSNANEERWYYLLEKVMYDERTHVGFIEDFNPNSSFIMLDSIDNEICCRFDGKDNHANTTFEIDHFDLELTEEQLAEYQISDTVKKCAILDMNSKVVTLIKEFAAINEL